MALPSQGVRAFIEDCYQLISANSPTVPLHGDDISKGIQYMNELLNYYGATGLMTPISRQVDFTVAIGQGFITFGDAAYTPIPDITSAGRLVNLENAWLTLNGVAYPLIDESRNQFFNSYYFDPLQGLPRYIIVYPETNLTKVRIFPAPSQVYNLSVYGKFELGALTSNDTMDTVPNYYIDYLRLAVAKKLSRYKGRSAAWDEKLEADYREAKDEIKAASSISMAININQESWLNGSWRVRSGI